MTPIDISSPNILKFRPERRIADTKGTDPLKAFDGKTNSQEVDILIKKQPYYGTEGVLFQLLCNSPETPGRSEVNGVTVEQKSSDEQCFTKLDINTDSLLLPQWSKGRLEAKTIEDGFAITDNLSDVNFNDAELFTLSFNEPLPCEDKVLSLDLRVMNPESMKGLWGDKVFQILFNDLEIEPYRVFYLGDSDWQPFSCDVGGDGKCFLPLKSGVYQFEIPKEITNLAVLSFMTAGAVNYDIQIKDIEIHVIEEIDAKKPEVVVQANQYGYFLDRDKRILLEMPSEKKTIDPISFEIYDKNNKLVLQEKSSYNNFFSQAGSVIAVLDFSQLNSKGEYTLRIPVQNEIDEIIETNFKIDTIGTSREHLAKETLNAFTWFTSGELGPWEGVTHEQDRNTMIYGTNQKMDVYGGWHDAGDYNKYVVTGAYSAGLLLQTIEFSDTGWNRDVGTVPRENSQRKDVLSYINHELEFLLKMQREDGAVHHKVANKKWLMDNVAPEDDKELKVVMPISTTATADFVAVMAKAYRHLKDSPVAEDRRLALECLDASKKAWQFLRRNPQLVMVKDTYDGLEYGGPYTDSKDQDERLWAAVELFRSTGDETIHAYIKDTLPNLLDQPRFGDRISDWQNVNWLAIFSYVISEKADQKIKKYIINVLRRYGDNLLNQQKQNPYNIAYAGVGDSFDWGSNSVIATTALQLCWITKITGSDKYIKSADKMMEYFLGVNPIGISYVTGIGKKSASNPHYRPSVSGNYPVPVGMLVGGPNSVEYKGDTTAMARSGLSPMKIYADKHTSYATNEVAINWQAKIASLTEMLTELKF